MGLLHSDKGTLIGNVNNYKVEIYLYDDKVVLVKNLKLLGGFGLVGLAARATARAAGKGKETIEIPYSKVYYAKKSRAGLRKALEIAFWNPNKGKDEKWKIIGLDNMERIITIVSSKH